MQIPDTAILAAFSSLFAALVAVVRYARNLNDDSAKKCQAENQEHRETIGTLREIIECMLNGDPDSARLMAEQVRQKAITDQFPALTPRPQRRWRIMGLIPFVFLAAAVAIVVSCGKHDPAPRLPEVPAEIEARDLAQQHTAELRAAIDQESAASALTAAGNPAKAAEHRAAAERHRALATELAKLRQDAEHRVSGQQREMDRRAAEIERQADERAAAKRQAEDDRWIRLIAGGGIFLAIVAAVFMRAANVPGFLATGAPAALAAGCAFLAVWPTIDRGLIEIIRWLLIVAAVLVGLGVLGLLAWAVRWLVREWQLYADSAAEPGSAERQALDKASRDRQPRVIRWLFDHFFRSHP